MCGKVIRKQIRKIIRRTPTSNCDDTPMKACFVVKVTYTYIWNLKMISRCLSVMKKICLKCFRELVMYGDCLQFMSLSFFVELSTVHYYSFLLYLTRHDHDGIRLVKYRFSLTNSCGIMFESVTEWTFLIINSVRIPWFHGWEREKSYGVILFIFHSKEPRSFHMG